MYNCIFTAHCTEAFCDRSCPILVETSYLLERNGIAMNSSVFSAPDTSIQKMLSILAQSEGKLGVYRTDKGETTVQSAELLTYCAICKNWRGSRLHCTVYNLKYSRYLDETKKSWSNPDSEVYEYMKIWAETAKVLVVSNFDYVNFGDFESQILLNLIQQRQANGLTTILVSPPIGTLVSSKKSPFFDVLTAMMKANVIKPLEGGSSV